MKRFWLVFAMVMLVLTACAGKEQIKTGIDFNTLEITESVSLSYAEYFSIDKYGDYTMVTIKDEGRFLVVPEDELIPSNVPRDITILKQPLDKTYLVSTSVMDYIVKNNALSNIRLSGLKQDDWYIEEAKKALENGDILYAGKYSAPDYELIISQGCNLAIENTMIYHNPEAKEKLEELGIPVIVEKSSYEPHPLGRLEWIKLYGILYNTYDTAADYYNNQLEIVESIKHEDSKPLSVAFFSVTSNGSVTVRKPNDYIVKMIEIAGGNYALSDYLVEEENSLSTINIQMEDFYVYAENADILIYNSTIEGEINSINDILQKSVLFKDFKAVKEGRVYCTSKNFFQQSTGIAEFITDINLVINGEEDCTYLKKLN